MNRFLLNHGFGIALIAVLLVAFGVLPSVAGRSPTTDTVILTGPATP